MLNKKEITAIAIITIILAFTTSLVQSLEIFLYVFLSIFIIIIINILAKKIAAFYLDSEIEISLWELKRYGFKPSSRFKKPIPAGALFPLIFTVLSLGTITWMASLIFEVRPQIHRAAKRHGLYSFSEMTESHIGLIAAAGIAANLIFVVIGYLIGLPQQMNFATLSAMYVFFNMLPISDLDGNKIFFGNLTLWSILAAITLIAIGYVFLLV